MTRTSVRSTTWRKPTRIEDAEACVAIVLDHYGVHGFVPSIRGNSLLDICVGLQEVGFRVTGFKGSLDALRSLETLCVVPTEEQSETTFVVCFGYESGKFVIGHPRRGIRRWPAADFARRWASGALLRIDGFEAVGDRCRCFDVNVVRAGHGRALVRAERTGIVRLMSGDDADRLLAVQTPRTLEAHEAWLTVRTAGLAPAGEPISVSERLKAWVDEGFIVTEAALRRDVARVARTMEARDGDRTVSSIGIPTCGRNAALERALRSYLTNVTTHARRPRIVVADTSTLTETTDLERRLNRLRAEFGLDVVHLDVTWKRTMAHRIADETGCGRALAQFALLGGGGALPNYGANRNALLLATAGELSLHVDDDTLLPLTITPSSGRLSLSSSFDPNEYWFDDCDWETAEADDVDFVQLHEDMLGRHPAGIVAAYRPEDVDVGRMEAALLRTLERPQARVAITFLGHRGDAGTASNGWRLFLAGETLRRLVQPGYAERISRRDGARVAPQRTISDGLFCSGMNMGLDNRTLLPPFTPVGRNEDGVFSAVLSACFPGSVRGFREGYAISHAPVESRPDFTYPIRFDGFKANDLLALLINEMAASRASVVRDGLGWLGHDLTRFGSLGPIEFEGACRSLVYRAIGAGIARIEQTLLDLGGSVPDLTTDVARYLESIEAFVVGDGCGVPVDLPGGEADRRAAFQTLVRRYGELLIYWPEIVRSARYVHIREMGDA